MQIIPVIDLSIKKYFQEKFTHQVAGESIISAFLVYISRIHGDTKVEVDLQAPFLQVQQTNRIQFLAKPFPDVIELNPDYQFETIVSTCLNQLYTLTANLWQDLVVKYPSLALRADSFVEREPAIVIKKVQQLAQATIETGSYIYFIADSEQSCAFVYNPTLWQEQDITRIAQGFQNFLLNISINPYLPIHAIRLISPQEQKQLVYEWNDTAVAYPKEKLIQEVVEEQVRKTPHATALICDGITLTYQQVNQRANQLARYLQKYGVGPEVMVGICLERSLDMIVGLLAILKAGGAYVPLDKSYPSERLQYMVEETKAPYIITVDKWKDSLPAIHSKLILLDKLKDEIEKEAVENVPAMAHAKNLACVIFTSGSTGKPKGVCILHQGVVRLVKEANYAQFNQQTVILGMAPVAFDVSLCEIWGSLANGGKLVLVPSKHPSLIELKHLIKSHQINTLFLTVALFHLLVEQGIQDLPSLKQILTGGDVLSLSHARRALEQLPDIWLVNSYGPTENTCYSSFFPVTKENLLYPTVPIGRPNSNSQVYILDNWMQPVPAGIAGEVYVGGDGLARGYLNKEELTKERFVKNPFQPALSPYVYKTGDQARYLPDGNIEFIGRLDSQVKIRGFRIEPGEIETVIKEYDQISEAVVIADGVSAEDKKLIAYVQMKPESHFREEIFRDYLKSKLPEYMVPAFILQVSSFPLTPHGKIDKKNLPSLPLLAKGEGLIEEKEIHTWSSNDELHNQLLQIWKQVLNMEWVGPDDDFFKTGGNSLLAVKLVSAIHSQTGYSFPVSTIFAKPTVRQLACFIRQELTKDSWNSLVPVQAKGTKKPIFCIHPINGDVDYVYKLAAYFDKDQPVYGLQAVGLNGQDTPLETIEEMAAHYNKLIIEKCPEGPYHLAGYSIGGLIAYEMARQLMKKGKQVGLLALFDTYAHKLRHYTYLNMPFKDVVLSCRNYLSDVNIPLAYKWEAICREVPFFLRHLIDKYKKNLKSHQLDTGSDAIIEAFQRVKQAAIKANQVYVIKPSMVHILFFRMMDSPVKYIKNYAYGWRSYATLGINHINLPGAHASTFKIPSNIQLIAQSIQGYIQNYNERMATIEESVDLKDHLLISDHL